jgi:hypothetical protein
MRTRIICGLIISLAVQCGRAAEPAPPCKTPKELMKCVQHALQTQDTNLFWKLHCWTNVSPKLERFHKFALSSYFKKYPDDRMTFGSFRILPPLPEHTRTVTRRNGSQSQQNLPVEGWITFRQKGTSRLEGLVGADGLGKRYTFSADGELLFGKAADGNYWLSVIISTPPANTNSIPGK